MFTGIVQHLGTVAAVETADFGSVLWIDPGSWEHHPTPGASIAVNGCCLTVSADPAAVGGRLRFDVVRQTLRCTALGGLAAGAGVNLEPAVTATTLLSGHVVQGHIDGVGTITRVGAEGEERRLTVEVPPPLRPAIVEKGSIAVDGVSLTVAALTADGFEVALIPTTLRETTLGAVRPGQPVNLETDYIAKIVLSWLERMPRGTREG